jgi:hypothetical protein
VGLTKQHLIETGKAHAVNVGAETKVHDTETRAHTALAVEEVRAGGKILDTHAQAGHDAAAAERMVQAGLAAENKPNGGA